MSMHEEETKALEAKIQVFEARKAARAAAGRLVDLQDQLKRAEREDEEEFFQANVRDSMPDKEMGVHWDFLRFGDHLVAFAHNKPGHDIFIKKLPDKGQANPSEVRNFVNRSLIRVNGESDDPEARGNAFSLVAEEFPGAPNAIANVLLELAKGGTAVRQGK